MFTILTHIRVQLLRCLYNSLWQWAPLGTTTVTNRMTIDSLIVTKNHKLKTSYTPVTECKHPCRSTQCNTSSSAPCTHSSGKHWHLRACTHPLTYTQSKSQPQCTLSDNNKRELLSVVKIAYTHWETKVIQALAKTFTGKLRGEKLNPQVTRPLSFLEECSFSSGTLQFWKGWHCCLLSAHSHQPALSSEVLWLTIMYQT